MKLNVVTVFSETQRQRMKETYFENRRMDAMMQRIEKDVLRQDRRQTSRPVKYTSTVVVNPLHSLETSSKRPTPELVPPKPCESAAPEACTN